MFIVTTDSIATKEIVEVKGLVKGIIVNSKHIGKDIGAAFKTIVGGELNSYTEMLNDARQIAMERMINEAKSLGANAIIGVRLMSSSVMDGAAEMVVYGTAVVVK